MPMPRIHQVVRAPSLLGYPRPFAGEITGSQFNTANFKSNGETGYNPNTIDHNIANAWTVSFWYSPTSATQTATETLFHLKDPANSNNTILIQILGAVANDPLNIVITDSAGATIKDYRYNSQTNSATTNGMYTFTWDGSTLLFYRDTGTVAASTLTTDTTGTMTNTNRAVGLMSTVAGANARSGGQASCAVWNTALSAVQIDSLWAEGLGAQANLNGTFDEYSSAASLVHWWRPGFKVTSAIRDMGLDYATGAAAKPYNAITTTNAATSGYASVNAAAIPRFTQPAIVSLATNEYFANSTQQPLGFSTSFSISFWWRWTAGNNTLVTLFDLGPASGNANRILVQLGANLSNDPLQITMYNSSGTLCKDFSWDRYSNAVNGTVNLGSTFFTLTWDEATDSLRLYRNGEDLGTATTLATNTTCSRTDGNLGVWIGATKAAGNATTAAYHSMAIWDKVLKPGEIAVLWNEGYPTVDLSKNTLGYYGADNLKHWWRLTRPPGTTYATGTSFTTDYVKTGGINVETNSANLTTADVLLASAQMPVGHALNFNGAMRMEAPAATWGIANSWTIDWAIRPGTLTGTQTLFQIGTNAGANTIRVDFVDAGTDYLDVYLYDSAGALMKNYRYNTPWSAGAWNTQSLTWNGTTLTYYRLASATAASSTPTNNAGTMTDTSRPFFVAGLQDNSQFLGAATRLTTLTVWNSVLTANEIFTLHKACSSAISHRQNFGDYASAANLKHMWRFGADPNEWGKDFVGDIILTGNAPMYDPTLHAHALYSESN